MHPFRRRISFCLLCFIIIIITIIILNLFLLIIVVIIVKFNVLKIIEDMKCVVIHYLLLRASAVYCLSVHKSLSSVIKILMFPAGYVWMFCIQCTFFWLCWNIRHATRGGFFQFDGTRMLFI